MSSSGDERSSWSAMPLDVLLTILDPLVFSDVLNASHTCRHWRAVAHTHHTFSGSVTLSSARPAALRFFLERVSISASNMRLVELYVRPAMQSVLSATQAAALIDCIEVMLPELLQALSAPAPSLKSFAIRAQRATTLPGDILGSEAPLLQRLLLENVDVGNNVPRAFRSARSLECSVAGIRGHSGRSIGSVDIQVQLPVLATQFTRLRELSITTRTRRRPIANLSDRISFPLLTSLSLHLHMPQREEDVLGLIDAPHLLHLTVSHTPNRFAFQLEGPLHMEILEEDWSPDELYTRVTFRERSERKRCITLTRVRTYLKQSTRRQLLDMFVDHVVSASIPLGVYHSIVAWCGRAAPALSSLELILEERTPLPLQPCEWECPKLEQLTLVGVRGGNTTVSEIDTLYLSCKLLRIHKAARFRHRGLRLLDLLTVQPIRLRDAVIAGEAHVLTPPICVEVLRKYMHEDVDLVAQVDIDHF